VRVRSFDLCKLVVCDSFSKLLSGVSIFIGSPACNILEGFEEWNTHLFGVRIPVSSIWDACLFIPGCFVGNIQ